MGVTMNYSSTANYKQDFDPAVQTITSAPWEVEASVEHNGESVHQQVLTNFKPGDVKTNLIKFINNNDYDTTFLLEVTPGAYEPGNNLFLNPNIELILKINNEAGVEEVPENIWRVVEGEPGSKTYKYQITVPGKTIAGYQMDIQWNHGENDTEFANKAGKINYKVVAEQTIVSEGVEHGN